VYVAHVTVIGVAILRARLREFRDRAVVSQNGVSHWEAGDREPTWSTDRRICRVVDHSPDPAKETAVMVRIGLLVVAATATLTVSAAYPAQDAKEEVIKVSHAYDAAIVAKDAKFFEKHFDDDGRFIGSDGRVFDKKSYSADYLKPSQVCKTAKGDQAHIRIYGDTAVESGLFVATGTRDGKPFSDRLLYTATWVKKGGVWKLVAEQGTKAPETK
jgi:ketosteroid isomerase-like protein